MDGVAAVSYTSVSRIRDAMAEMAKQMNMQQVTKAASAAPDTILFRPRAHDEASARARSYAKREDDGFAFHGPRLARSRSSKVQNNVAKCIIGDTEIDVWCELQGLLRKDAATIAHALRSAVTRVVRAALDGRPRGSSLRIVHALTGDSIFTNGAAARRLYASLLAEGNITHRLIVIPCAYHLVNLVVAIALRGKILKDPISSSILLAICSRLFKRTP